MNSTSTNAEQLNFNWQTSNKTTDEPTILRKPAKPGTPTLDLIIKWNRALLAKGFANKTIQNYISWGDRIQKKWPSLNEDSFPAVVLSASASLKQQNYSSTTIHHFQCAMASFSEAVWGWEPERRKKLIQAKPAKVIHQVPSQDEVFRFLECLSAPFNLIASLCYGCGLRISEAVELQLGDVNLNDKRLTVRLSKCAKGRTIPIPQELVVPLQTQAAFALEVCNKDLAAINVLANISFTDYKIKTSQGREPGQWPLFPQRSLVFHPRLVKYVRVNLHQSVVERAFKEARIKSKVHTRITPHRLRDAFAVHSLINGVPVNVIQNLLGHGTLETTAKYLSFLLTADGAKLFPGINLFKKVYSSVKQEDEQS